MATQPRPFEDMGETGLLWLINTAVLHPRGYALALHYDDDGRATGWSVLSGNGEEAYDFLRADQTKDGSGVDIDAKFRAVEALLREARDG
jgi:hypothetical protein